MIMTEDEAIRSKNNFGKIVILQDGKNTEVLLTRYNFLECLSVGYKSAPEKVVNKTIQFKISA